MALDAEARERTPVSGRGTRRAVSLLVTIAMLTLAVAVWQVGVWANHWYIAEQFLYPLVDEAAKEGPYWDITQLLRSGNEALLRGSVCLGVALVCVVVAVVLRRRPR